MTKKTKEKILDIIKEISETKPFSGDYTVEWAKFDALYYICLRICDTKYDSIIISSANREIENFRKRIEKFTEAGEESI